MKKIMKRLAQFLLITIIIVVPQKEVLAQQGTFNVGYSFGLITKGGLSFGYSITDNIVLELHLNAIPHMFANGVAFKLYPLKDNFHSYLIIGFAYFGDFSPYLEEDSLGFEIRNRISSARGINFGIGNEFNLKQGNLKLPIETGINYILDVESQSHLRRIVETENEETTEYRILIKNPKKKDKTWSGFFLVGVNSYFKLKSKKVDR